MLSIHEDLLRAIFSVIARQTFSREALTEIICPPGSTAKQLQAYNLCDGARGQAEIVKELRLDTGNFSRTVARWLEAGVVHRLGVGREARLLHVYPLGPPSKQRKRAKK